MSVLDCSKTMKYTVFEDNNGTLELAKTPMIRTCNKYMATHCHQLHARVVKGDTMIEEINADKQEIEFLAKPLVQNFFCFLRKNVMGWKSCAVFIIISFVYLEENLWILRHLKNY